MKLRKEIEIADFLAAIRAAKGEVWLSNDEGNRFNLKSTLSRYVAIAELIKDDGLELELFCGDITDEPLFFAFFEEHPDVL